MPTINGIPRVCGGDPPVNLCSGVPTGIPRVCGGDPYYSGLIDGVPYVFPACAGVIPWRGRAFTNTGSIPRVCGGDPPDTTIFLANWEYSPRVRG